MQQRILNFCFYLEPIFGLYKNGPQQEHKEAHMALSLTPWQKLSHLDTHAIEGDQHEQYTILSLVSYFYPEIYTHTHYILW